MVTERPLGGADAEGIKDTHGDRGLGTGSLYDENDGMVEIGAQRYGDEGEGGSGMEKWRWSSSVVVSGK